ncbi:MAG: hypothetical protein EBT71_03180 [Alphaproteobacteria bacterium]|nr:hypothetical protein [Alphaproteobacteria bacterium]
MQHSFIEQFEQLNEALRAALAAGNFDRARAIDAQRQQALLDSMDKVDDSHADTVLAYVENCAAENAALCTELESALAKLSHQSSQSRKMLQAYGRPK